VGTLGDTAHGLSSSHSLVSEQRPIQALAAGHRGRQNQSSAMSAPTIRDHLKHHPGWIWAHRGHRSAAIPLAPYIRRYGLDISLTDLTARLKADSITIATYGRNNEYRFAPIEQVPTALKGYALTILCT
jgi:hypothetical protein